MDKVVWKLDDSTIWHWFGYWLGVFFIAYLLQLYGYWIGFFIGLIGSQIFWFLKELIWDKMYRKQPFNLADVLAGWLFGYVIKIIINTQKRG